MVQSGHSKTTVRWLSALDLEDGLIQLKASKPDVMLPRWTQNRGPKGRTKSAAGLG